MTYEIVVVGGGIGGLTVAALLAARGANVCLLEREAMLGGCAAPFEKFGYTFEQGAGLYSSWQPNEIHARVFSELPVEPPEARPLNPAYIVRLPDNSQVRVSEDRLEFEDSLRAAFPECSESAIQVFRQLDSVGLSISAALKRVPELISAGCVKRTRAFLPDPLTAGRIVRLSKQTVGQQLERTSFRFRRFLDLQLQELAQASSEDCSYLHASVVLSQIRKGAFSIRGGVPALAEKLAEALRRSGGTIRLNAPVLRLTYGSDRTANGVTLLSGESINASRAIISNMTIWDTYGKLIGLDHTPLSLRKILQKLTGWGAYLLFLAIDEAAAKRLPAEHIFALTEWLEDQQYDPQKSQLIFSVAPEWNPRAPTGRRAVTVHTFTNVEDWFAFHEGETEYETQDQLALEAWWTRLHDALPELGGEVEIIDTATPRTLYDLTRRKLGMVGGMRLRSEELGLLSHRTVLPNVFMVGDTTLPASGIAGVTLSGLIVANLLTR